jgi:hypothetical protein
MSHPRYAPPSMEDMIDARNREGFFESSYGLLERRFASLWKQRNELRAQLAVEKERVLDLEAQLGDWRVLAFKYGTETTAEKRLRVGQLVGSVTIDRDLAMMGDEAIVQVCLKLARDLQREAHR